MVITDAVPGCAVHGVLYGQRCYMCPQTVSVTFMTSCPWCPAPAADDEPVLKIPAHMASEGGQQIARLGAGWNEVFPGLQCAIFLPTDDDGNVVAHFRLTPEDGDEPADA